MQSQMTSHPQFPGSSSLIHHQLQQHQQSFPAIMENGIVKEGGKTSSARNFYNIRPSSKEQEQESSDLKAEATDQMSDNETDVESFDSLSQFSEQKKAKSSTNFQGNNNNFQDDDNEDDSKIQKESEKSPPTDDQDPEIEAEVQRSSKKRRRSSKTSNEESPQEREKKRSNLKDDDDEEEDEELEKNGNLERMESPASHGESESPTQTEIKVQKPLGLLAQHGLSSNKSSNLNLSQRHHNQQQQQQQQYQHQLENQHRHQFQLLQQQRQQHYNSLVSRKGKFFDGDMNFNPFVPFPMKTDPERSSGDLYRDWGSGFKDIEGKSKKSPPRREDEEFEAGLEKDARRRNGFDGVKEGGVMLERSRSVDDSRQILLTDRRFMPSPPPNSSPTDKSESSGHHWTFEEQFKQLYEMSGDPKRKEFLDDLFSFMQKRGTPVNRIPIMAKQTLDLYELFRLVISKGGLVEVINKKLWREITKGLNLPSSITSAAFTLRTQYMKYLYPYECEKLKLSSLSELQSAIDGNRREGRRPGFDFSPFPPLMPGPGAPHLANLLGPIPMPGGQPGGPMHGGRNGVLPGCDDRQPPAPFLASSAIQQLHMGGHFRSMMAEHDARLMHEAATRAMEEVAKRVEESARSALVQPPALTPAVSNLKYEETSASTPHQIAQSSSSPSQSVKRPGLYDDQSLASRFIGGPPLSHSNPHMGQAQGPPHHQSSRIKINSQSNGRSEGDGSMSVSMEINGTLYHGVLFPSPHQVHI